MPSKRSGYLRPVALCLGGLLVCMAGSASEQWYLGPGLQLKKFDRILVHNSQLRYSGSDRLTFSTKSWAQARAPELLPYVGALDTWASRYSLHPRVLGNLLAADFARLPPPSRRSALDRIAQISTGLASVFDTDPSDPYAATQAVIALAEASGVSDWQPAAELAQPRTAASRGSTPSPLFGYFQPPWEIGETWAGGGAHGGNGSGNQNALDFWAAYRGWGEDLSDFWVTAMQAGTVRVWSSCSMAIVHPNGWVTDYYHLDHIQVSDRSAVERNSRIALYADNRDQALCSGGSSSGPHVHMSLSYNGSRVLVNEDQVDFTAFSHHIGQGQYDSDCSRSYYNHSTLGTVCPNRDQLLNNAPPVVSGPIFANGFES